MTSNKVAYIDHPSRRKGKSVAAEYALAYAMALEMEDMVMHSEPLQEKIEIKEKAKEELKYYKRLNNPFGNRKERRADKAEQRRANKKAKTNGNRS